MNPGYQNKKPKEKSFARTVSITEQNYVDEAEAVIRDLNENRQLVSTSKIRSILSMVTELYHDARRSRDTVLDQDMQARIQYLRMRFAYEAGREAKVKRLTERADIFNNLKAIGDSRDALLLFCHYMEAMVAYHKFYGGREIDR